MKIGVVAPSMGLYDVEGLEKTKNAIKNFESLNIDVIVGDVYNNQYFVSNSAYNRAMDFLKIYNESDIIISISGGEFMIEILRYLDFEYFKNNKKLFMGYSDNTNLTYLLTTISNIPTIYGLNFKSFGKKWDLVINNFINLLLNKQNKFKGFDKIEEKESSNYLDQFNLTKENKWKYILDNKMEGILLGGCLDVILNLIGTKYDNTLNYIKNKNIIWYFDICDLNILALKRAIYQLYYAGYFNNTKGIILSRFYNQGKIFDVTYDIILQDIVKLLNIPIFYDVDLGHIMPVIPFINGLNAKVSINDGIGEIIYDKGEIEALTR